MGRKGENRKERTEVPQQHGHSAAGRRQPGITYRALCEKPGTLEFMVAVCTCTRTYKRKPSVADIEAGFDCSQPMKGASDTGSVSINRAGPAEGARPWPAVRARSHAGSAGPRPLTDALFMPPSIKASCRKAFTQSFARTAN